MSWMNLEVSMSKNYLLQSGGLEKRRGGWRQYGYSGWKESSGEIWEWKCRTAHEGQCGHAKEFGFHPESSGESLKDLKVRV